MNSLNTRYGSLCLSYFVPIILPLHSESFVSGYLKPNRPLFSSETIQASISQHTVYGWLWHMVGTTGIFETKESYGSFICFTANTGCMAFETCGSINSVTLIAEDFMQFVMAVAQVCTQISLFSLQQARDPPNIFAGNI